MTGFFKRVAVILHLMRVLSISFMTTLMLANYWVINYVMDNPSLPTATLAFFGTQLAISVPAVFKVFEDIRVKYEKDEE